MILGMTIAIVLAAVTMRVGAWVRLNKGIELGKTGFWAGLLVALVLFAALGAGTALPREIVSGIAIGLGVGIAQGFGSPAGRK